MQTLRALLVILSILGAQTSAAVEAGLAPVQIRDAQGQEVLLYEGSYALLIGVSDYTNGWPDLPGVKDDLKAMRAVLERHNFKVEIVENPNAAALSKAFETFVLQRGLKPNNRLFFYYAGHGHTEKRAWGAEMGYLVPADAPNPHQDPTGFLAKAMDMQQIEVYAKRIDAKHALFVFDSCFSGSLFSMTRSVPQNISYKTVNPVRQFITAGSADEEVADVSIFRRQLVSALEGEGDMNKDGYVSGAELGEFLQDTVVNYSKGAQHPQYGKIREPALDKGDFVFQLAVASPTPPVPAPPVLRTGQVQVNVSVADVKVHLNNRFVGTAGPHQALNLDFVPTGLHEIRAEADGFVPETRQISVRDGQWTQELVIFSPVQAGTAHDAPTRENLQSGREPVATDATPPAPRPPQPLIEKARVALQADRLTLPRGDNAIEYAEQALALAPEDPRARQVLTDAMARYTALSEAAIDQGELEKAQGMLQTARKVAARHHVSGDLLDRLLERVMTERQRQATAGNPDVGLPPAEAGTGKQNLTKGKAEPPKRTRPGSGEIAQAGSGPAYAQHAPPRPAPRASDDTCSDLRVRFGLGEDLSPAQNAYLRTKC